jgi:hypothetical protein
MACSVISSRADRRLFNALTALSLIMCGVIIALWVRTYWREDKVQLSDGRHAVFTGPGRVWLESWSSRYFAGFLHYTEPVHYQFNRQFGPFFGFTKQFHAMEFGTSYAALGFVYCAPNPTSYPRYRMTYFAVPCWPAVALTSVLPLIWLGRRCILHPAGWFVDDHPHCRRCGYDLTGKPADSHRCAECGADLTARRGVVMGRRRRLKSSWIFGGSLLLLISLTTGGFVVANQLRTIQWVHYFPVKLLLHQAQGNDPGSGRHKWVTSRIDAMTRSNLQYRACRAT